VAVEAAITQFKKDFYAHIKSMHGVKAGENKSTLAVLTDEELAELENAWIQLAVWKQQQSAV
jgi:hypothetical protein